MPATIDVTRFRPKRGRKLDLDHWPTRVRSFYKSKSEYKNLLQRYVVRLSDAQTLLYAHDRYALLLIFQAMDAAGKDSAIKHVMGTTQAQLLWYVVLPTATPGILTGVMLAVARAAGETAPLIFTALFSSYWIDNLMRPTASLAVLIYNFSGTPFANQVELAWAASLVLVVLVLAFNITGQVLSRNRHNR